MSPITEDRSHSVLECATHCNTKGHSNANNKHYSCRRRGLCAPGRGQEQDCWQHGSNRKHVPKHRVDLRSSRRASQYEGPNGAATAVALTIPWGACTHDLRCMHPRSLPSQPAKLPNSQAVARREYGAEIEWVEHEYSSSSFRFRVL